MSEKIEAFSLENRIISSVVRLDYDYVLYISPKTGNYRVIFHSCQDPMPKLQGTSFEADAFSFAHSYVKEDEVDTCVKALALDRVAQALSKSPTYSIFYSTKGDKAATKRKKLTFCYLEGNRDELVLTRTDVTAYFDEEQRRNDILVSALTAAKQASAAKSEFLSRMSHEIRTPMNAIIGMAAIAAQSMGNDEQVADCIGKIGLSSRFLLSLINDILDMSRIESGKVLLKSEKIPFEEFINEINTICYAQAQEKNVDYECVVDPRMEDYYMGDAMKLKQIVINVVSNAIKFTGDGGKVSFICSQVRKTNDSRVIRFVINDTGCGISEEFMEHLYEPFVQERTNKTTMYGGTGLGLAITKSLVELMDGKINVRSIVGIGTEFTIDVKLGVSAETKIRTAPKGINFNVLRSLVVDDDVVVCEQTVTILHDIGMKAEWVDTGIKAVERVKSEWSQQKYYDFIIIDWRMPDMDGIETARRIRQIVGPDVTIIIMTAYDWASIEREAKMAGVNMLVTKPMFRSTLISAFERALQVEETEETITEAVADYDFTGKRLLLVEDHPLNVEVAQKLLENRGFEVEVAENGLKGLETYASKPTGYYNAILMDVRMPVMDGLQATRSIRLWGKEDAKTIPIIAMTANAFEDDVDKSKAAGMNAHLNKPIEPQELYRTLYVLLNEQKKEVF